MMKQWVADLVKEIGIIVLIGVLPIVYAFVFGGANIAEQVLLKLLVDSRVTVYLLAGAIVCLLLAWLEHRLMFGSATLEGGHRFMTSVLLEAVHTLAGLLRIIAGALLGFLALGALGMVLILGNINQTSFAVTGVVAATMGFLIARQAESAKRKWLRGS